MVGHGGSSAGSYLADPTSPIPSHCASIVVTSTVRVNITISIPHLSTQSNLLDVGLLAGASCPPTAYRNPLHVATPTPPLRRVIGAHRDHLLVCGSKHSTDRRHELPSRPPTAYNLQKREKLLD